MIDPISFPFRVRMLMEDTNLHRRYIYVRSIIGAYWLIGQFRGEDRYAYAEKFNSDKNDYSYVETVGIGNGVW